MRIARLVLFVLAAASTPLSQLAWPDIDAAPAHDELHVWAWRDHPNGAFVDLNLQVSCEGQ